MENKIHKLTQLPHDPEFLAKLQWVPSKHRKEQVKKIIQNIHRDPKKIKINDNLNQ